MSLSDLPEQLRNVEARPLEQQAEDYAALLERLRARLEDADAED